MIGDINKCYIDYDACNKYNLYSIKYKKSGCNGNDNDNGNDNGNDKGGKK